MKVVPSDVFQGTAMQHLPINPALIVPVTILQRQAGTLVALRDFALVSGVVDRATGGLPADVERMSQGSAVVLVLGGRRRGRGVVAEARLEVPEANRLVPKALIPLQLDAVVRLHGAASEHVARVVNLAPSGIPARLAVRPDQVAVVRRYNTNVLHDALVTARTPCLQIFSGAFLPIGISVGLAPVAGVRGVRVPVAARIGRVGGIPHASAVRCASRLRASIHV